MSFKFNLNSFLILFSVICLASGLFFSLTGGAYLGGDDVYIFSYRGDFLDEIVRKLSYLELTQKRAFLTHTHRFVYQFFNSNPYYTVAFGLIAQLFSCFLLYQISLRFLSKNAALLCILFFVTYIGKEEIIAKLQSLQYHFVILFGLVALWLTIKTDFPSFLRMFIAGLLLWITAHWYEILIVTVPFYFLAFLFVEIKKQGRFKYNMLLPASLPALFYLFHVFVLSLKETPLWHSRSGVESSASSISLVKIIKATFWGLDTTIGPRYFKIFDNGLRFFKNYFHSELLVFSIIYLIGSLLLVLVLYKQRNHVVSLNLKYKGLLSSILFSLVLLAPLVSITMVNGFIPERFSYVGSIALAVLIGLFVDSFQNYKIFNRVILVFCVGFILMQGIVMGARMKQQAIAGSFDEAVHARLLSVFPTISDEDHFVFLYPEQSEVLGYFQQISPVYLDRSQSVLLWDAYPQLSKPPKMIAAQKNTHRFHTIFVDTVNRWSRENKKGYLIEFNSKLEIIDMRNLPVKRIN